MHLCRDLDELPFTREIKDEIGRLEIETETRSLYLNPNVDDFVRECVAAGKTVALLSDMYYSAEQLRSFLLAAGMSRDYLDEIYVSSEHGVNKASGGLFKVLLAAHPEVGRSRVLHIGDHETADVLSPREAGLQSLHYRLIPQPFGSVQDLEKSLFDVDLDEISSLRKLAGGTHPYPSDSEESAFHALGAEVLGPVYALFADWVVDQARSREIATILPMMREGELLARVVNASAASRGVNVRCVPLHISRQPAFIASIHEANYPQRISQTLLRGGRRVGEVVEELGAVWDEDALGVSRDIQVSHLTRAQAVRLEDWLLLSEVRDLVLTHASRERSRLVSLLKVLTQGEAALTLDIGTKGSTERYLHDVRAVDDSMPPLSHALVMGSGASTVAGILDGVDIVGWLGIAGENDLLIDRIRSQIQVVETFVNAPVGTTLGYQEIDGVVTPVLADTEVPSEQARLVEVCWQGIDTFQSMWLSVSRRKPELREALVNKKTGFLGMLLRFIESPTITEAKVFGDLVYADMFNGVAPAPLAGVQVPQGSDEASVARFIAKQLSEGVYWPQAAVSRSAPDHLSSRLLGAMTLDPARAAMARIFEEVAARGLSSGVVFGASDLGRSIAEVARLYGNPVLCFVDSDRRLHGTTVNGVPVLSLEGVPAETDHFIIASYVHGAQIRSILQERYAALPQPPVIFDLSGASVG